jgi:uncharacterized membrane protein YozB (DUF420 family)
MEVILMGKTWRPTTAGILNIISGAMGIIGGFALLLAIKGFLTITPAMIASGFGIDLSIIPRLGALILTLGIIALVGGIYAIKRRKWGLALAGSILALFTGAILGLLSIIFVSLGRKEFT